MGPRKFIPAKVYTNKVCSLYNYGYPQPKYLSLEQTFLCKFHEFAKFWGIGEKILFSLKRLKIKYKTKQLLSNF